MYELQRYSATARITVLNVHTHTLTDEQRSDRTTNRGQPFRRVGLTLMALALALLVTDRGVPRYVRPRARLRSQWGGPALPAGRV
jgi:hypothetical protein